MMTKDNICSKPRTIGELAAYYSVDRATFKKWIQCETLKDIRPEVGRYFSIRQVRSIVAHFGSVDD